jgi:hypothetical protein
MDFIYLYEKKQRNLLQLFPVGKVMGCREDIMEAM